MKPKLSIIVPTIRPNRWKTFYDSIKNTIHHPFEVIFAGPCAMTSEMEQYKNIKVIRDFGSPVRARQMCIPLVEGEIITWASDDSIYLPKVLDEVVDEFPEYLDHVFVGVYTEGQNGTQKVIQPDGNWKLNHAYAKCQFVDDSWWHFNTAFMRPEFLMSLGGFDCRFQACAYADADLAVRAYRAGAKVDRLKNQVVDTDWAPGIDGFGDHRAVWFAQTYNDEGLYKSLHNDIMLQGRTFIDFHNWKDAPAIWPARFDRATVEHTLKF